LAFATTISTAGRWPDGSVAEAGDVLLWSGEDDPTDTILPRLIAMGANLDRIHIIQGIYEEGKLRSFDPSTDISALNLEMEKRKIRFLIIDPLVSAVSGDSHKNAEVRRALQPLFDIGVRYHCSVFGISHFSKGTSGREPLERVTGSLAFAALSRLIFAAVKLPEEDDENHGARLFARAKSNIGPDGGGFKYFLQPYDLPDYPGINTTRLLWGESVDGDARDLIEAAEDDAVRTRKDEAADWLREILADGPRKAKEVEIMARKAGFTDKVLRNAREKLKIVPRKQGFRGPSEWDLPKVAQ
jgi:putative DNA primase/helicase